MKIDWSLNDLKDIKSNNKTVFSCFACGGGSSMGYKLAGYNVICYNEIDKRMSALYDANLITRYKFVCDIRELITKDLPEELFHLDILDGSPPCTTFSTAGLREKTWGIEKQFKEGQTKQILDDLSFHFINFAKRIKPKLIVMENVSGIMKGNAQKYVANIYKLLDEIGYQSQYFILHADRMNVPQKRVRFILLALRNDLCNSNHMSLASNFPLVDMTWQEKRITLKEILIDKIQKRETQHYSEKRFADVICDLNEPMTTITTKNRFWLNKEELIGDKTLIRAQTFPQDYNFLNFPVIYTLGMSVPPYMMYNIAKRVENLL
jgi:DNA (cytosine-5)-methyltransferase 1